MDPKAATIESSEGKAFVVKPDILASNGVVHVVDTVFWNTLFSIHEKKNLRILPGPWFVIMGTGLFSLLLTITNVVGEAGVLAGWINELEDDEGVIEAKTMASK